MASTSPSESMSTIALEPLNALTTHLDTLINSLVNTNSYAVAPTAASSLVSADDALTSALATLKRHQQNYARILNLREEAARLEDELKNIIRKAVSLREDVGRIHPSILDDDAETSEEEDTSDNIPFGQGKSRDVDYNTLLNFAARIGKHNSLAAREAEQEGERRKIEATRKKEKLIGSPTAAANIASALANASAPSAAIAADTIIADENTEQQEKDELELQAIGLEESLAAQRAQQGLGYPDGMLLRMGELGRLQKIREDAVAAGTAEETEMNIRSGIGEDAVEREIERLVRETEVVATKEDPELERKVKQEKERREREEEERRRTEEAKKSTAAPSRPRRESVTQRPPAATAPKRKKINLDFGGDDDDDDDDD